MARWQTLLRMQLRATGGRQPFLEQDITAPSPRVTLMAQRELVGCPVGHPQGGHLLSAALKRRAGHHMCNPKDIRQLGQLAY